MTQSGGNHKVVGFDSSTAHPESPRAADPLLRCAWWRPGRTVREAALREIPDSPQGNSVLWHRDRTLRIVGMAVSRPTIYRSRRHGWSLRRAGLILGAVVVVVIVTATLHGGSGKRKYRMPSHTSLVGLSLRQRVVAIVNSQVGYRTDPSESYCNKFSAFWLRRHHLPER